MKRGRKRSLAALLSLKRKQHAHWVKNNLERSREIARKSSAKQRAKRLPNGLTYLQDKRAKIIEHYGGKCACCNEAKREFLTIDHINGGGTKHRNDVGRGSGFYHWLVKNKFPKGFRILCYNCNCSRGHYGYCPHEKENS